MVLLFFLMLLSLKGFKEVGLIAFDFYDFLGYFVNFLGPSLNLLHDEFEIFEFFVDFLNVNTGVGTVFFEF